MTNLKSLALVAVFMPALFACTVMALKQDVEKHQVRVADKEGELKNEEAQQAHLREESIQLKKDLATKQVSLDDLKSRLEQLQRLNENTMANTKEKQTLKRKRETKLRAHQNELVEIQQSDTTLAEKERKLKHLKEEISKSLNLLVHL